MPKQDRPVMPWNDPSRRVQTPKRYHDSATQVSLLPVIFSTFEFFARQLRAMRGRPVPNDVRYAQRSFSKRYFHKRGVYGVRVERGFIDDEFYICATVDKDIVSNIEMPMVWRGFPVMVEVGTPGRYLTGGA